MASSSSSYGSITDYIILKLIFSSFISVGVAVFDVALFKLIFCLLSFLHSIRWWLIITSNKLRSELDWSFAYDNCCRCGCCVYKVGKPKKNQKQMSLNNEFRLESWFHLSGSINWCLYTTDTIFTLHVYSFFFLSRCHRHTLWKSQLFLAILLDGKCREIHLRIEWAIKWNISYGCCISSS